MFYYIKVIRQFVFFHEKFPDNPDFSVRFRNCIFYAGNNFVVFYKTKHSSHKHLRVKTVNAFI